MADHLPAEGLSIVRTVPDLRERVREWCASGETVALVPTMGALHDGHLALVRRARQMCGRVVASVFVNPKQFGPDEDLARYPRQEAADAATLASAGADLLYAPAEETMYPGGFATTVRVAGLGDGLCGPLRPGHFDGVATVVTKLLLQCLPDVAVFGEKDYQQLQVIRRLARDLDIPVHIEAVATVREATGLALSSRNAYLDDRQRVVARQLYEILARLASVLPQEPCAVREILALGAQQLVSAGFNTVEYLELSDAQTLEPLTQLCRPARLLGAVRLGATRLIDNIAVTPEGRAG